MVVSVADDAVDRLYRSLGVAARRATALIASLLLDGGVSPGPNFMRTAAGFGLGPDLSPLQATARPRPEPEREPERIVAICLHPDDAINHPDGVFGGLPVIADPVVPIGFARPAYVKRTSVSGRDTP